MEVWGMAEPVEVFACLPATVKPNDVVDPRGPFVVRPAAGQTEFRIGDPVFDANGEKVGVVENPLDEARDRIDVRLDVDWVNKCVMPGIERCQFRKILMSALKQRPRSGGECEGM